MGTSSRIREAQEARLRSRTAGTGTSARAPAAANSEAAQFVRSQLKALEPAIGRALPTGIRTDRFVRIILTEISKSPKLAVCHIDTILGAVMTAAQLGLEFGPLGHAYLVPYKGKCQLIIGYRGYIDLARRSGQLRSIVARTVHAQDQFEFEFGTSERLTHRPALSAEPGPAIAYYGIARVGDADPLPLVLSRYDVDRYRQRSMSGSDDSTASSSPWTTDYDAMALKTVVRRMVPWLPLTVEAAQAIETDEHVIQWDGEATSVLDVSAVDDDPTEDPSAPDGPESDAAPAGADSPPAGSSEEDAPQ